MELDELKQLLLAKPAVTEEIPFGPEALVYKLPKNRRAGLL